eukprot:11182737-Lingulodinium_polyedra.AAC.1
MSVHITVAIPIVVYIPMATPRAMPRAIPAPSYTKPCGIGSHRGARPTDGFCRRVLFRVRPYG